MKSQLLTVKKNMTMKKFIPLLAIASVAVLMVACNNNPQPVNGKMLTYVDTTGFAAFQAAKAGMQPPPQVIYYKGNEYSNTRSGNYTTRRISRNSRPAYRTVTRSST